MSTTAGEETAARDVTARLRIRQYLADGGPVVDDSGRATAILRDAIAYSGRDVGFIQLITAMDKAGELTRDIRGKRTYRIALGPKAEALTWYSRPAFPESRPPAPSVVAEALPQINYDELARALIREGVRMLRKADSADQSHLEAVEAERNEYAKRLVEARNQLEQLLGGVPAQGAF